MNTNSNTYTVIYTTLVCVLVAAILAFVSQSLKPKQEANEKAETISQILTAAGFDSKEHWQSIGNEATIAFYKENIAESFTVTREGVEAGQLDKVSPTVFSVSQLKVQNRQIKNGGDYQIPVYVFSNGVTVFPIYGAGLWGPVWGYISLDATLSTVQGAFFDHESETPGLGGKIKDDPSFRAEFVGETPDFKDANVFDIVKGGAPRDASGGSIQDNKVDAITGATMTSNGLDAAIDTWLAAYAPYVNAKTAAEQAPEETPEAEASEAETPTQTTE